MPEEVFIDLTQESDDEAAAPPPAPAEGGGGPPGDGEGAPATAEELGELERLREENRALKQQLAAALARDSGRSVAEMRRAAIGCWSAMVGAMIMARSVDDPALSAEILAETRAWIEQSGIGSDAKP